MLVVWVGFVIYVLLERTCTRRSKTRRHDPKVAKVCFHTMKDVPSPDKPGSFSVDIKTPIYFNIQDRIKIEETDDGDSKKLKASFQNAGAMVPISSWSSSPIVKVMWSCKWTSKGLAPVCPKVVVKDVLTLQPGTFVKVL